MINDLTKLRIYLKSGPKSGFVSMLQAQLAAYNPDAYQNSNSWKM